MVPCTKLTPQLLAQGGDRSGFIFQLLVLQLQIHLMQECDQLQHSPNTRHQSLNKYLFVWNFIGEMINAYKICEGQLEGKRKLRGVGICRRIILKRKVQKIQRLFPGYRIASNGGRLWIRQWRSKIHKIQKICWWGNLSSLPYPYKLQNKQYKPKGIITDIQNIPL